MKINQLYEAKALDVTPVCPQERLVIISKLTGLSFALERIGPLAATITTIFYLLVFYLSAISKTPKNLSASIYSEFLIKTACQHLLLLVGFDTLIYRNYYDTPPYTCASSAWCPRAPLLSLLRLVISKIEKINNMETLK